MCILKILSILKRKINFLKFRNEFFIYLFFILYRFSLKTQNNILVFIFQRGITLLLTDTHVKMNKY